MLEYRTQGFSGFAVKYSPFFDSRIAIATAANFGLIGNGRLYILQLTPQGIVAEKLFDTQDGLFDLAWSETHENQVLAATGDGSIKLFDVGLDQFPVQSWKEHSREVLAVHWNLVEKSTFISSARDGHIKVWSPHRSDSLLTIPTFSCTYNVSYSPHETALVAAVCSDSFLRIYDLRSPMSASDHLVLKIPVHGPDADANANVSAPGECLTHDWNKYKGTVIATAGVDTIIRTFDIRSPSQGPMTQWHGHDYAVRRISWSPHRSDTLLSASYDMTCRVWRDGLDPQARQSHRPRGYTAPQSRVMPHHTEFVTGVDWCMFGMDGWAASVAWDERLLIWNAASHALPS